MIKTSVFGLIGLGLATIFWVINLILGLVRPGYNHFRDPVSSLVNGKWGWVQQINFVIFILAVIMIGYGLRKEVWQYCRYKKSMVMFFALCVGGVVMVVLFPISTSNQGHLNFNQLTVIGKIHYLATIELLVEMAGFFYLLIDAIKRNVNLKNLVSLSQYVLYFNLIFGSLWFYFNERGLLINYLGLWQKILVLNVLIWMITVGYRLKQLG